MIDRPHDCTPESGARWVQAEAEKCDTIERISERLEQEVILSKIMDNKNNHEYFPNLVQAHLDLIKVLTAKRDRFERMKAFTVIQGGKE